MIKVVKIFVVMLAAALSGCATVGYVEFETTDRTTLYHGDKTMEHYSDIPARIRYTDTLIQISIAGGQWLPYHCEHYFNAKKNFVTLRTKDSNGNNVDFVYHCKNAKFGKGFKDETPESDFVWDAEKECYVKR